MSGMFLACNSNADQTSYVVEKILGHRFKGDVRAYSALSSHPTMLADVARRAHCCSK